MLNDIKRTRLILVILFRNQCHLVTRQLLEICMKVRDYKLCNDKKIDGTGFILIRKIFL